MPGTIPITEFTSKRRRVDNMSNLSKGSVDTVRSNQQGFTLNIKSLDGGYSGSYILQAVVISDFDTSTPLYRCIDAFFSPAVGQQRVNPFTFTKSTSRVENSLTLDETTTAPSGGLDPAPISRPTPVATSAPQTLSTGILPASTSTPEPVTSPSTLTVSAIEPVKSFSKNESKQTELPYKSASTYSQSSKADRTTNNTIMNSLSFASNATSLLDGYSPTTSELVSWFAVQNASEVANVISSLCDNPAWNETTKMDIFWAMNETFYLSNTTQQQMSECFSFKLGNPTAAEVFTERNPYTTAQLFYANPYTPKSKEWFLELTDISAREMAVDFVCSFVGDATPIFEFYRRDGRVPETVSYRMNSCLNASQFAGAPLDAFAATLWNTMDLPSKRLAVLKLCKTGINSTQLTFVFSEISNKLNVDSIVLVDMQSCLAVLAGTQPFLNSSPTAFDGFYVTFQPSSYQVQVIDSICAGQYFTGFGSPLDALNWQFQYLLSYMNNTNTLTQPIMDEVVSCKKSYEAINLKVVASDPCGSWQGAVWFESQDASTQTQIISGMCTEYLNFPCLLSVPNYQPTNQVLGPMLLCPQVQQTSQYICQYIYLFLTIFSSFNLLAFLWFSLFVEGNLKQWRKYTLTAFHGPLIIAYLMLIGLDVCFYLFLSQELAYNLGVNIDYEPPFLASQPFRAAWGMSYLYFSFRRSQEQMLHIWPRTFYLVSFLFLLSPLALLSPVFALFLPYFTNESITVVQSYLCQAAAVTALFLLDLLMMLCFVQFLYTTGSVGLSDPKFIIISKVGIANCMLCIFMSLLTIAKVVGGYLDWGTTVSDYLTVTTTVLMHLVSLNMFLMKIWIQFERKKGVVGVIQKVTGEFVRDQSKDSHRQPSKEKVTGNTTSVYQDNSLVRMMSSKQTSSRG
ncbi:hypothetical protein BC830DRAFT_1085481 [Chytriomyces sp. MP71]|nr:hypothetical protein BC830DRAFT_1085481 [Chytriomyces sp. MP71]